VELMATGGRDQLNLADARAFAAIRGYEFKPDWVIALGLHGWSGSAPNQKPDPGHGR